MGSRIAPVYDEGPYDAPAAAAGFTYQECEGYGDPPDTWFAHWNHDVRETGRDWPDEGHRHIDYFCANCIERWTETEQVEAIA